MADSKSFATLAPQHTAAMRHAARALVGTADADDAAQEAILRAWQAWPTLVDESRARSWLLKITVNVCLQWRRGRFGTYLARTLPYQYTQDWQLATLEADPGTSDHLGSLDLRRAINELGDDIRIAVVLRYYGGLDANEIGETLGAPAATIRTRIRRGLIALHAQLAAGGPIMAQASDGGSSHG